MPPTAAPPPTPAPPPSSAPLPGRRWRLRHLAAVVAVVAAVVLLVLPATRRAPAPGGPQPLAAAWPGARIVDLPGSLADGPAYEPKLFLDAGASIGTAPSPDGTSLRLVWRGADGAVRELRRLPPVGDVGGLTSDGETLAWAETGSGRPRLYAAAVRPPHRPRMLTADAGDLVLTGSAHDLLITGGRLHWAAADGGDRGTLLRSVALTGGPIETRAEPGQWAQAAWPWLVSGGGDRVATVRVRNRADGRGTDVPLSGVESAVCGAAWCRVLVQGDAGLARIDLMRPDGRERRTIADGSAGAAVADVAVLDRFEILTVTGPEVVAASTRLLVHDIGAGTSVAVADGVDDVASRGGVLWWSTGDEADRRWHVLDLRTV